VNRFAATTMGFAFLYAFAALPAGAQPIPPAGQAVADSLLADVRGMADVRLVEQSAALASTSTVQGNTINGDFTTGMVSMSNDAFDNFNGLALFNINTGNNVAINSSMTVNVAIQP